MMYKGKGSGARGNQGGRRGIAGKVADSAGASFLQFGQVAVFFSFSSTLSPLFSFLVFIFLVYLDVSLSHLFFLCTFLLL